MKLLLTALVIIPVIGYSQIQVKNSTTTSQENIIGEVKLKNVLVSKLTYDVSGRDTVFTFTFSNAKNSFLSDYQMIVFVDIKSFRSFYEAIQSVFADENKRNKDYKIELTISDMKVVISGFRNKGDLSAKIETDNGFTYLSEKQAVQLFGSK